ncbi:MAG: hypothetical protein IPP93_12205 [Chitinophagaceae bacterium]|nr:hypothetical protein [Chitinophagaceae bacterium]
MQVYLNETNKMVKKGQYKEALQRFIWFNEHALEYDESMTGVRLSFALGYWKELGDIYPPALTAMKDLRNKKIKLLTDNKESINLFQDISAFDKTLSEDSITAEVFKLIHQKYPYLADRCWIFAKESLFETKEFGVIKNYITNPLTEYFAIKKDYKLQISLFDPSKEKELYNTFREGFVLKCLRLIEFAVWINNEKAAKEIQSSAINIINDTRLREILP